MKKIPSSFYLYGAAAVAVVGLFVLIGTRAIPASGPSVNDGFAQCLTEKGATMYGAWWCPHCKAQKELFDTAIQYVKYVECSQNVDRSMSQECKDAGVKGYPTWIFADGSQLSGEQTFEALGKKADCAVPGSDATSAQ